MRFFGRVLKKFDYDSKGLFVRKKSMDSFTTGRFQAAYDKTIQRLERHTGSKISDMRWHVHTAVWAAQTGLRREGDFVELGVCYGFLSEMICELLDFGKLDRKFYLFDTFEGIPAEAVSPEERERVLQMNALYADVYELTKADFAKYPNVELVRGVLPGSLSQVGIDKIAYLSIDLNYAAAEIASIEQLWDRLVPGAVVVLDDYAWQGHEPQKHAWDTWAERVGASVFTVPTGQGLIVK